MAKVSVIIPVYKVEEYLSKCMESVLRQLFRDIEIILVDDGSPDNSGKMCDDFATEIKGIPVYVIHQMNGGLSAARNSGIDWAMACSESEWLCFVDSDDTISELYIEKMYDAAVTNDADLVVCDFTRVSDVKNAHINPHGYDSGVITEKEELFDNLYRYWGIHPAWNKLYQKALFSHMRFQPGRLHEDEFIIHEVLFWCHKAVFIPDELYIYLVRQSGIMGTENRRTKKDGYLADIIRYWFCKEHKLPIDRKALGIEYMTEIQEFNDIEIKDKYKEMYFDYEPNRTLKKRLSFLIFPIYNWYRKRRLD